MRGVSIVRGPLRVPHTHVGDGVRDGVAKDLGCASQRNETPLQLLPPPLALAIRCRVFSPPDVGHHVLLRAEVRSLGPEEVDAHPALAFGHGRVPTLGFGILDGLIPNDDHGRDWA